MHHYLVFILLIRRFSFFGHCTVNTSQSKRIFDLLNMIETDTYTTVQEMVDSPMIKKSMKVDMSSHVGLRGFAAIWVMVFHTLFFSKHSVDLQGSSLMPLFFLLSGFSLAVAYGDRCGEMYFENKLLFYQNRIARVYPLYYICTLFALPLWFYGYGSSDPGTL